MVLVISVARNWLEQENPNARSTAPKYIHVLLINNTNKHIILDIYFNVVSRLRVISKYKCCDFLKIDRYNEMSKCCETKTRFIAILASDHPGN